jgi:hypothetical protein
MKACPAQTGSKTFMVCNGITPVIRSLMFYSTVLIKILQGFYYHHTNKIEITINTPLISVIISPMEKDNCL